MLDDDARRLIETAHALPRRIGVSDVVVRQFLALQLRIAGEQTGANRVFAIERGRLVRIFAVAHLLQPHPLARQHFRIRPPALLSIERRQVVRDHAVVARGMSEDLLRERKARHCAHRAGRAQLLEHTGVIGGIDDGRHALVVLGCRSQHRRSADVDVLDRVVEAAVRICDSALERVEVDRQYFDRVDPMLGQRLHMRWIGPTRQQPGMDARVERLDAPVEHLGKAGVVGDLRDRDAGVSQQPRRAAGRKDVEAE